MIIKLVKILNKHLFSYTLKDRIGKFQNEMVFLNSFNEPKDLFERSFFQYKAQKHIIGNWKFIILNLLFFYISLLLLLFRLFYFLFRTFRVDLKEDNILAAIAIFETIPSELLKNKNLYKFSNRYSLLRSDILFIGKLTVRYWYEPYFILKNLLKISLYSKNIQMNRPKTILVQNEYSFTSSVLTEYCRSHKILHINVMHGEKLLLIRDSFFEYDQCYVWNEHYKQIFLELRANYEQFIVCMPESFEKTGELLNGEGKIKYYLNGSETEMDITIIRERFPSVIFRPHPLYSNSNLLENLKITFENPLQINIENSIAESDYVCARYSTVLFQAWLKGVNVIIDDETDNKLFEELKLRKYFLLTQKVQYLSSFGKDEK